MAAVCPICRAGGVREFAVTADDVRAALRAVFGAAPPEDILERDYAIERCGACDLVFADPMIPGSAAYYAWLTRFPGYHAGERWEWAEIRRLLNETREPLRLLELGAGAGDFLISLKPLKHVTASGVDLSGQSARAARAKGADVEAKALEDLTGGADRRYDMVVLSHVLEHVAEPLKLIQDLKQVLTPSGRIVFSVPYSPMTREYLSPDLMNLPPHHLTRWNKKSLETLGEKANLNLALRMPKPKSALKRALKQTCDAVGKPRSGLARLPVVLRHWGVFRDLLSKHRAREVVNGKRAADTVLAVMSRRGD